MLSIVVDPLLAIQSSLLLFEVKKNLSFITDLVHRDISIKLYILIVLSIKNIWLE